MKMLKLATVTLALAVSASTFASTQDARVKVTYSKAELTYATGRERVYDKLQSAARRVCGPDQFSAIRSFEFAQANKSCYQEVLSTTLEKIGNPELSALHEG